MSTVKEILQFVPSKPVAVEEVSPPKGKGKAPQPNKDEARAPAVPHVPPTPAKSDMDDADAFSVLDDAKRRTDQVELMRDRKILEYETFMRKGKEKKMNTFTDRYVAACNEVHKLSLSHL